MQRKERRCNSERNLLENDNRVTSLVTPSFQTERAQGVLWLEESVSPKDCLTVARFCSVIAGADVYNAFACWRGCSHS